MCNLYRTEKAPDAIRRVVQALGQPLLFPEGLPNAQPRDVRITERAPILRAGDAGAVELVERRWSWPGPTGKPVFNFRSEGRRFPAGRCAVIADGFYEFTPSPDSARKAKDRWLFTLAGHDWFGIAGITRTDPEAGEAFTMLTCAPGPDVAPIHDRQVAVLTPAQCLRWLEGGADAEALLGPLPAGTLAARRG